MVSPTGRSSSSTSSDDKHIPLKVDDNNVDSSDEKSVVPSEKQKESCSDDQPKVDVNSATDEKVDISADEKVVSPVTQGAKTKKPWCRLISEYPQNQTIEVYEACFPVGSDKGLCLLPHESIMCLIRRTQYQGNWVAVLEREGKQLVQINGKTVKTNSSCFLSSGDQLVFGEVGNHAYIFQLLSDEFTVNSPSHARKGKELSIGNWAGDASAVAGAYILDSSMEMLEESRRMTRESTSGLAAVFKEDIDAAIIDGQDIQVSFDDFPYYLSENTKNVLISSSYIQLKHREQLKYTSELPAVNSRILLSGPAGSEIYQEMLVKALAHYYGAKLLIFDSHALWNGLFAKDAWPIQDEEFCLEAQQKMRNDNLSSSAGASKNNIFMTGDRVRFIGYSFGALHSTFIRGPTYGTRGEVVLSFKDNPSAKVGVRFDKPILYGVNLGGLCDSAYGFFCKVSELRLEGTDVDDLDNLLASTSFATAFFLNTLFEVVLNESRKMLRSLWRERSDHIRYIKDTSRSFLIMYLLLVLTLIQIIIRKS